MQDFRRLDVIAQARVILRMTYAVTASFPDAERFGIVFQMRKAAVAVGSNIAEGCGRSSYAAFRVSLDRGMGELSELEFQCIASQDLEFGDRTDVDRLLEETIRGKKMLARFIVSVRNRQSKERRRAEGHTRPIARRRRRSTE